MNKKRIVVGLSGGVDSAVSAWLLKQQGHEVLAVFMQNWEDDNDAEYCSIKQDALDALSVADILGIDIDIVNFAHDYKERVFANFLAEYQAGRTPNPDVLCNAEIKFKAFLDYALAQGAQAIATGHYARIQEDKGQFFLLKALDTQKDQSYFLYRLNQAQLQKTWFPLGEMTKTAVRELAAQIGLPVANKKDSTGICFIGERPFRAFLQRYLPTMPGNIVTPHGQLKGQHLGLMYYTIGQRRGLGVGGQGRPWFVADKDLKNNQLIVVQGHDHPRLFCPQLTMTQLSWILTPPAMATSLYAKTRYRMADAACTFSGLDSDHNMAQLNFVRPQWAMTPGQSAVLYQGDRCLGGGIIV